MILILSIDFALSESADFAERTSECQLAAWMETSEDAVHPVRTKPY